MAKGNLPKWSTRKPKRDPSVAFFNIPITAGPDTDGEALQRDLDDALAKISAGEYSSNEEAEAEVRRIVAQHGARAGDVFDSGKLVGALREVVELGADLSNLRLWREAEGEQRWFIGDRRWFIFVEASQVPMIVAAGVVVVETGAPEWRALDGDSLDVSDFATRAADLLDQLGPVTDREKGPRPVAEIGEVLFPLDAVAVLCRMGAVRVVLADGTLEARDHTGRVVGYAKAFGERRRPVAASA